MHSVLFAMIGRRRWLVYGRHFVRGGAGIGKYVSGVGVLTVEEFSMKQKYLLHYVKELLQLLKRSFILFCYSALLKRYFTFLFCRLITSNFA